MRQEVTICVTDADCGTGTDWISGFLGMETKTTVSCLLGTCNQSIIARCAPGYYDENGKGQGIAMQLSCAACPEPGTSEAASKQIINCYVPANTEIADDSGAYIFTSYCMHKIDLQI